MKIKKILYIGAKLLTKPTVKPYHQNVHLDHVTLWYCGHDNITELPEFIGQQPLFYITYYFFDSQGEAFSGCFNDEAINDYALAHNQYLHVTISVADGISPAHCHDMVQNKYAAIHIDIPEDQHAFKTKLGAFVVFEDDSTGWVFEK